MKISNQHPQQTLIRKPFDSNESVVTRMEDPSLTQAQYESACDLGKLIAGHIRTTGQLPAPPAGNHFVDLTKLDLAREIGLQAQREGLTAQQYVAKILQESDNSAPDKVENSAPAAPQPTSEPQDSSNSSGLAT